VYQRSINVTGLAKGEDTVLTFPPFGLDTAQGTWRVRCSTSYAPDSTRANDTASQPFYVVAGINRPPAGWHELKSLPSGPSGKKVKDGGWLVYMDADEMIYAAKGYKTTDFYHYDPYADTWGQCASIPLGREGKPPSRGAAATCDGEQFIYATKGNNTPGFYRYNIENNAWSQLADVPLGSTNKKVKGGTDLAFVEGDEHPYVYLLKGYKNEFWRYDADAGTWLALPLAPQGANIKWDKGSWIVFDDDTTIYAHKAKYNELWSYAVNRDSWGAMLKGMPLTGGSGRRRKSKDGGSATWADGIYALKGGNTTEFWLYLPEENDWHELDSIPAVGSTGKKRRVKAGGDITTDWYDTFYALKGNKTFEFWRYVLSAVGTGARTEREGVMASGLAIGDWQFAISPNPLASGFATLSFTRPLDHSTTGPLLLSIYNVAGQRVMEQTLAAGRSGIVNLDLRHLSNGVYLVKLESQDFTVTQKLVVQR
jgi:hypothetical protein